MLVGIVGKPSVGKSTFFKALTLMDVGIANYPFTTIKPNHGIGHVKIECVCKEFGKQCNPREGYSEHGFRFVPVDLMDVAGLVPGAYEGKGMGNQFLDDLRQADVLIHIVDISGSTNEKGESVPAGSYDPSNDVKFLEFELDMWYLGIFKKIWKKFSYQTNQEKGNIVKAIVKQFSGLKVNEDMVKSILKKLNLNDKLIIRWDDNDVRNLAVELRKATKPMIIAANKVDFACGKENLEKIQKQFPDYIIVPCSAESELALKEASKHGLIDYVPGEKDFRILEEDKLNDNQKNALSFIKQNILDEFGSSGVQEVLNKAVFYLLGYIAIFPGGVNKLEDSEGRVIPDCFLMPRGTTALDFAFRLHSDIGNNFIRAINVKTKLPLKKDQQLNHRDVIEIVFNK
ncbi:redox-regulated ATPase YchF [Candidatus Woesearchaeota archaeon]|nr:redox-regulated ATPase YchF [Candidatus Woesearchaeota archaeon]